MWIRNVLLVAICAAHSLGPAELSGQTAPFVPPAPAANLEAPAASVLAAPAALAANEPGSFPGNAGPAFDVSLPCRNCGYWIVSSRHCPQYGRGNAICCAFEYFHSAGDGCLHPSSREQFLAAFDPLAPTTIMVHGSFVNWEDIKDDSRLTYDWLCRAAGNLPANVVFFTWPSEGPVVLVPQIDIGILGRRGEFTGLYLGQFISELPQTQRVSLLGHSHGARAVASALHVLGGGCVQGYQLAAGRPQPARVRAVLAAAAIDHHWMNPGERYGNGICRAEGVLNLKNRFDLPLTLYPLRRPFSNFALARTGFTARDRRRMGSQAAKVFEIDVSHLILAGHMWPNYYEQPQIAQAIVPFLYFADDAAMMMTVPAPAPAPHAPAAPADAD